MTGENEMKRGMILTAGPSISEKEVDLVMEAVTQGWNSRHSEFIKNFQTAFAEYLGVKYAMCTSSCTGALHLALAGLGLKPGDEVLVPENTWVASGVAPTYVGAKPVVVDLESDTWCMSPESLLKQITPKTKAIIPVHLYGHPCDMDEIMAIAKQHKLLVIEDAAPSVGARWKGQLTGSFGDASAFSFQGAKIMVSGEGGMFCTNDETLYKKAQYLNDYAVDTNKSFWIDEIGFKYRMSNLQAAIGLAQLQRIEELVDRKRQIFKWYEERLKDFPEFYLSTERPNARNIYWMSSIVLNEDAKIDREEFRAKLKDNMVDTRPFFHPMSSLPVFTSQEKDNPIAYSIANRGINLPSGHNLREDDIDYIADSIIKVLGKKKTTNKVVSLKGPTGRVLIEKNQTGPDVLSLEYVTKGNQKLRLEAFTYDVLSNTNLVNQLCDIRKYNSNRFPSQTQITNESTHNWLKINVLDIKDRMLFWVVDSMANRIGHLGIRSISLSEKSCELDAIAFVNLAAQEEYALEALRVLQNWINKELGISEHFIRVLSDDTITLVQLEKLNFEVWQNVPQKKVTINNATFWKEIVADPTHKAEKYLVTYRCQFDA